MLPSALTGNALVLAFFGVLGLLEAFERSTYIELVQEDGVVEWATVWILVPGLWLAIRAAKAYRSATGRLPWFQVGLAAFCVFFAGEEVSWGQRLFAYAPPDYFLEHNTQQELNVHNLFKKVLRTKYLMMMILGLWGVLMPLLGLLEPLRRIYERLSLVVPSPTLVPSFLVALWLIIDYPWKLTGEVVETGFALCLFVVLVMQNDALRLPKPALMAGGFAFATLLSFATPRAIAAAAGETDPERIERVILETLALKQDWFAQREYENVRPSDCGTHIRLYTWVRKHSYSKFRDGAWTQAFEAVPPAEADVRGEYFLDPWNNPYWVRHSCRKKRKNRPRKERVFIYSFGPNRKRESSKWKLKGDDEGLRFEPPDD